MANKIRKWTKEELEKFGLVDISERNIPGSELVKVLCRRCGIEGESKMSNLIWRMNEYQTQWACVSCQRLFNSERTKEYAKSHPNNFLGKTHTDQTKQKMKESSKNRWDNTPETTRKQIGEDIRKWAQDKYNGNPMNDPKVREKYLSKQKEFFSDLSRVQERTTKIQTTCLEKYGAPSFIQSDYFDRSFASKGESEVREFVESLGFVCKKRRFNGNEIDIFIEEVNIGIEYNGLYWHSEACHPKNYHFEKKKLCDEMGVQLIQIFENEWLDRKEQVKGRLTSLLGKNSVKIGARKCKIVVIDKVEASDFINKYHIQGAPRNIVVALGMFYKDELMSVMTVGKHHRDSSKMVMNRFVVKSGVTITGGLSKMSRFAVLEVGQELITWCDLRWSNGEGYAMAGWTLDGQIAPDYFYIKNGRNIIKKQQRRKSVAKTPEGMTEHQHALADKLLRVYDCGKLRFKISPV
jgi:hypothetical protein